VPWTRYDVFLSYSHLDAAIVDPFANALRVRGYRVFHDNKSIVVGERWKLRLENAIRSSRVCILCWSEAAKTSEYVAFEYSHAMGLNKPVLPWLMDTTSLPSMIELHGITERDPQIAVTQFLPRIGWRLRTRRILWAVAFLLFVAVAGGGFRITHRPPPPWDFGGRVTDSVTGLPLSGVEVDAELGKYVTFTARDGTYSFHFPPPRLQHINLAFLKQGYRTEKPLQVPTDLPWNTDMVRIR
jgi:hypothetical protein